MDMETIAIIVVSCLGVCAMILSIGGVVWMIRRGGSATRNQTKVESQEETRMIQEIHHGLMRMEDRVESLETLLLDTDRKKRSDFDQELHRGQ